MKRISSKPAVAATLSLLAVLMMLALVPNPALAQSGGNPQAAAGREGQDAFTAQAAGGDEPAQGAGSSEFSDSFAETGGADQPGSTRAGLQWSGFLDIEQGSHIGPDSSQQREFVLSNRLLRLGASIQSERGSLYFKLDVVDDSVTGDSRAELREARALLTPFDWLDLSAGRQVATWGVGDLLFINDLFPKNWQAIFLGRDPEFWKDSANALRFSLYLGAATWDVVYHPRFAPDTTPTGCRVSVFDPNSQALVALPEQCENPQPAFRATGEGDQGELASRLKVQLGSHELALYAYRGFYKSPRGLLWTDAEGKPTGNTSPVPGAGDILLAPYHPRLNVYGASSEGQVGAGILSLEAGRYESLDDADGAHPFIENSSLKTLAGYRVDWNANLSTGAQWFLERMQDYDAYLAFLPPAMTTRPRAEERNTYTLRVTLKLQQETLWVNLFHYERPQDKDRFMKLDFNKRLSDDILVAAGVNMFDGEAGYEDREFGMLKNDDNAFARIRYSF